MDNNYRFDYFYGSQSEQFSFFRLPKVIVRGERFKKLSSDAKILYGIMLDRMSLSRENKWVDQENRVYIIFTLNEVMKEFECCKRKAGMLMAELDSKSGIGLIEKKKQGLGKPDLIYLKNFIVPEDDSQPSTETAENTIGKVLPVQSGTDLQFQSGKNMHLQSGTALQVRNGKNMPPQDSKMVRSQSGMDVPANNTEYNKTDTSKTESIYPIHQDGTEMVEFYRRLVKENINYNDLCATLSILKRQMLNEIVALMVEVLAVNRRTLRIAGADYPYAFVKSRFLCLGQDHIEYVLNCLEQTSSRIGNIKAYILTCLFNAAATIDTYYTTTVNHNMTEEILG